MRLLSQLPASQPASQPSRLLFRDVERFVFGMPASLLQAAPAVALGLSLGITTFLDDVSTQRRLLYHPSASLSLVLTPQARLTHAPHWPAQGGY